VLTDKGVKSLAADIKKAGYLHHFNKLKED
jgi:hypothetical protein